MDPTPHVRQHKVWPWLAAVAAALITGIALCEWQGWPFLRHPIERGLSERLKREVAFGDAFAVHLLGSLRLRTDALTIGPPAWAAAASAAQSVPLVRAGDARVTVP